MPNERKIEHNTVDNLLEEIEILVALSTALVYGFCCWIFGENFPFSRYELYSDSAKRQTSAVIVFLADGVPADVWEYERFSGLIPDEFLPKHISSGLEWFSHEMARWVKDHQEEGPPGPIQVSVGYRLFSIDGDHRLQEDLVILQQGQAWRR